MKTTVSPAFAAWREHRSAARRRGAFDAPYSWCLAACILFAGASPVAAGSVTYQPVSLTDRIGPEIDRAERDAYGLFPDVEGFESARILRGADGKYRVEFSRREGGRLLTGSKKINAETFERTSEHARIVEMCLDVWGGAAPGSNARVLYQMALRHALDRRYDLAVEALDELRRSYPAQYDSLGADSLAADALRLAGRPVGLFHRGSVIDRSGFADLMIFAGYYGLWFGVATPYALAGEDASAEAIAAGMIAGPALSIFIANAATKGKSFTEADADMISLGGWMGTWQGVGWSGYADLDDEKCLQLGLISGLVGIGLAAAYDAAVQPSEGYAALMFSSVWWGAWLGLVGAVAAGVDEPLPASLVGSDVLLLATAAVARDTGMTKKRVRLLNLGGVLGAFAGSGLCVLGHVDDEKAAVGLVGVGSLIGAGIAVAKSRGESGVRSESAGAAAAPRSDGWRIAPTVSVRTVGTEAGRTRAAFFELVASF